MSKPCTMPTFTFPSAITAETIEDLLAFHHSAFGTLRMEEPDAAAQAAAEKEATDKAAADKAAKEFQPVTSQEEFDRRLSERLVREREKVQGKFADYDDLKKKAEAHDKALEAAMSESEKAVAAARKEGEQSASERSNARLVNAEARALAAEAKFRNPSLAVRALDLKGVSVNDEGEPDAAAIKAKLKELSDADPYLLDDGQKPKPKPDGGQGGSTKGGKGSLTGLGGDELYDRLHPKKTNA